MHSLHWYVIQVYTYILILMQLSVFHSLNITLKLIYIYYVQTTTIIDQR